MKHLFNVLILVIALCSCSNDGNNKDNHSLVSGGEVYHLKSDLISSRHMNDDTYSEYERSIRDATNSDVTHDIYFHRGTGVVEIKGPKVNTKIHVVDKARSEDKGSYRFMSIDESKKEDSNTLFTYIEFHYRFDGSNIELNNKIAGISLITINKDDTVDISVFYLSFESFYTYRRVIREVNDTSTNKY